VELQALDKDRTVWPGSFDAQPTRRPPGVGRLDLVRPERSRGGFAVLDRPDVRPQRRPGGRGKAKARAPVGRLERPGSTSEIIVQVEITALKGEPLRAARGTAVLPFSHSPSPFSNN